ncbi:hypothetical protein TSTA_086730 [Talaromyces stipitatus ATCC 10500]|uniref:Uncharacterized protein n=1 Tax=Talaromyces stipitatus (strain ATCC 10500 / CBS 375.48 / QM 6759 / NRRL 1006) TaxID=441959 RepID=B8M0Q7_TALSN|nr:uncharacterized protein TSTA_086730 [Talaromyces stipitatus ATCC 10500]EED21440.1 hypothetical protein TSTA_086730 [Talaromyces stipitatus ATCC 10500]
MQEESCMLTSFNVTKLMKLRVSPYLVTIPNLEKVETGSCLPHHHLVFPIASPTLLCALVEISPVLSNIMKYDKLQPPKEDDSDHDVNETLLHDEELSSGPKTHRQAISRRWIWPCIFIFENIFIVIVLLILWKRVVPAPTNLNYQVLTADNKTYPSGPLSWSQHFEALPCGRTPEEARARGCEFDMLVTAWLPPRCIDRELVDEFQALGEWDFYTKYHGVEGDKFGSYDPDFLGSVNQTIYTERRWHITHCLFMFKKLTRALVNGWPVDAEAVSEPHTEHCMKTFTEQMLFGPALDLDEVETYLEIIYPPC